MGGDKTGGWRLGLEAGRPKEFKPQVSKLESLYSPLRLWRLRILDLDATRTITNFTRRRQNRADAA